MAPFDGQDFKAFVAPAITPSRETEATPPASLPSVAAVLRAARTLIHDHGQKGTPCATNAVYRVVDDGSPLANVEAAFEPLKILANSLLGPRAHPDGCIAIWRWHDDADTTHADVLALFDRAILAAEGASPASPAEGRTSILSEEGV